MRKIVLLSLAFCLVFSSACYASVYRTIKCNYTKSVQGSRGPKDTVITVEALPDVSLGPFIFDSIDTEKGTARFIANQGAEDVAVVYSPENIHFFEITGTGNLTTTTVFPSLESVHSRHMAVYGGLISSQWYGVCEVLER